MFGERDCSHRNLPPFSTYQPASLGYVDHIRIYILPPCQLRSDSGWVKIYDFHARNFAENPSVLSQSGMNKLLQIHETRISNGACIVPACEPATGDLHSLVAQRECLVVIASHNGRQISHIRPIYDQNRRCLALLSNRRIPIPRRLLTAFDHPLRSTRTMPNSPHSAHHCD
jgi:hypothetical protein